MSYAPQVQKYAEPTQPTFEKKVGRRGRPTPDGNPGCDGSRTFRRLHFRCRPLKKIFEIESVFKDFKIR